MSNANKLIQEIIIKASDQASAQLAKISKASHGLVGQLRENQKALKGLNASQKKFNKFTDGKKKIRDLDNEIKKSNQSIAQMARELKATSNPTKAQIREFEKLKNQAKGLKTEKTKLMSSTKALSLELQKNGINTKNLSVAKADLARKQANLTKAIDREKNAIDHLNAAEKSYQKSKAVHANMTNVGVKAGAMGTAITASVGFTINDAISEEDAMLGIVKQVNELKNADNSLNYPAITKMRQEIYELSKELPMSTVELMNLYAAGAKMDVPRDELRSYVEVAAKAATAFDADNVEEMAESLGKINKNFKLTAEQGKDLADVINYLDDNAISSGAGIIDYMNRVSGIAGIAKITDKNMAALGSTLMTMGAQAEDSSTAVNAIFTRLASAPNNKKVFSSLQKIGLEAKQVQQGMAQDAQGTIMKIVEAIKAIPEAQQISVMADMVGTQHVKTMAKLVSGTEEWRRQIELANSSNALGSMDREFETRANSISSKWQILKNQLFNTSVTGGRTLFDNLGSGLETITNVLSKIQAWAATNPKTAAAIMKTIAVIGLLLLALSAISLALVAILGPMALMKLSLVKLGIGIATGTGKLAMLGKGLMLLKTILMALGRAFLANPIVAVITAIIIVAWLLYKNWDTVCKKVAQAWEWLKGIFKKAWNWLDSLFADNPILNFLIPFIGIPRMIMANWDVLSPYFTAVWNAITSVFSFAWDMIKTYILDYTPLGLLINNWDAVAGFFGGVWARIKAFFASGIGNISATIINWSPLGLFYQAFASVLSWFGLDLPAKFSDFGSNLIDGLINGIKLGFEKLKVVWNQVNSYLPDFARKKLEIHSPSRIMSAIGGYTMDGLTQGISKGTGVLQNTFEKAVGVFNNPLTASLGMSADGFSLSDLGQKLTGSVSASPTPLLAGGGGLSSAQNFSFNINISAPSGNAEDIGAVVRREITAIQHKVARMARGSFIDKD